MAKVFRKKRIVRKRSFKKRAPVRRKRTFRRKLSRKGSSKNFATCLEKIEFDMTQVDFNKTTFRSIQLNPQNFPRAASVALNYRYYKLAWVTYEYLPWGNMFQGAATALPQVPFLYTKRATEVPDPTVDPVIIGATSLAPLESLGARKQQLTRTVRVAYSPNNMMQGTTAGSGITGQTDVGYITPVWKKWWPTQKTIGDAPVVSNIPQIPYIGHYEHVDAVGVGATEHMKIIVTCKWMFKNPSLPVISPE